MAKIVKEMLGVEFQTDAGRINALSMITGLVVVVLMGAGDLFVKVWHSIHPSAPAPDGTIQTLLLFFGFCFLCMIMVTICERNRGK
ncbi:hypothetical protein [Micromonospora coerulea]|uniref:hypothetical protein n=1 Tax=Micromonospora coerulea TaxID=47856 RepID=UPI0019035DE5|nr:hypothetical protein [Micromonospora veneta]